MNEQTHPPSQTAVLVIDTQKGLFDAQPPPWRARAVLDRLGEIVAKARLAGAQVFWIQHDGTREENCAPFTEGWQIHPALHPDPKEPHVRKTTCDAFYGSTLEAELRQRHISRLVLAGFATDFCIDATLRAAVSRDFRVTVAADAHTTNDSPVLEARLVCEHHNWTWANCATRFPVRVVPTGELTFGHD